MEYTDFYDKFFLRKVSRKPTINKNILFNETVKKIKKYFSRKKQHHYEVLDIGCGPGHLVNKLSALDNVSVSGADITREILTILEKKYPEVDFYHKDFSKPVTLEKKFDVISAVEVIEHVPYENQSNFISNCAETLKADGMLVMTTPNKDKIQLMPKSYRATQPVEDWLTTDETRVLLEKYFKYVKVETRIIYLPTILLDAAYKRILYPFHTTLEQKLLKNTQLGVHILATATNFKYQ